MLEVIAPFAATVVSIEIQLGDVVRAGQSLGVLESMKMEHVITASADGEVVAVHVGVGDTVGANEPLITIDAEAGAATNSRLVSTVEAVDLSLVRADLAEVAAQHAHTRDEHRVDAVARRHDAGRRTARENLADLLDDGSFVEYGPLVVAAQRRRRSMDELVQRTPADGFIGGTGTIDGRPVVACSYDATVLAGTQGLLGHTKMDRVFALAERRRLPVICFAEGGGGRPGDTDGIGVSGLDTAAFHLFARLSGLVPLVGIAAGYCFAGNAVLLGCCDVVIGVAGSNIGMGGPAMIEGGGLGSYAPTDIGPFETQVANGTIDLAVEDEAAAVGAAKRYLSYFGLTTQAWSCADQRRLRHLVPEQRARVYDVRGVLDVMFDTDSVLELRRDFAEGIVTAMARVEGRPLGIVANQPLHLGGALDVDGAGKAARFLELCDGFDLPVVYLCDTPGFMVGPEHEDRAAVRRLSALFVTGANLTVPFGTIVLRKAYGLGAQAMAGGSLKAGEFCVAWPTGEFGGMNIEGAVRLGRARELAAMTDPEAREAAFRSMVERQYEDGGAVNIARLSEIDDVIDPAESRRWIATLLEGEHGSRIHRSSGLGAGGQGANRAKKRPNISTW